MVEDAGGCLSGKHLKLILNGINANSSINICQPQKLVVQLSIAYQPYLFKKLLYCTSTHHIVTQSAFALKVYKNYINICFKKVILENINTIIKSV